MIAGDRLPTLVGPRVTLRWLVHDDASDLFAIFSDPEVMRYWSGAAYADLSVARDLVTRVQKAFGEKTLFQWGITRSDDDRVIGTCTLFGHDGQNRRAELGYSLGRAHWGAGLMHEALTVLLDFVFGPVGLRRLEADIDPRNLSSVRAVERLGFVREGLLRERWCVEGEISDSAFYGLLEREWHARPRLTP